MTLSRLDVFAASALTGLLAHPTSDAMGVDEAARYAFLIAEKMVRASEIPMQTSDALLDPMEEDILDKLCTYTNLGGRLESLGLRWVE